MKLFRRPCVFVSFNMGSVSTWLVGGRFLDKVVGALTEPEDAVLAEVVLTDSVRTNLEDVNGLIPVVLVNEDFGAALFGSVAFSSS